jgi:putative FmdB family regulatory protein
MPIYEFYCADCHTVFNFLSRSVDTDKRPDCPKCGRKRLERRPSRFAVSRGLEERPEGDLPQGMDDARLEQAMASLAGELDSVDENDPRGAARLMRRLYETAGLPVGGVLAEALKRMEAGEDPDAIDAEYGDALDAEDPFLGEPGGEQPTASKLARRLLPPRTDPELHEL